MTLSLMGLAAFTVYLYHGFSHNPNCHSTLFSFLNGNPGTEGFWHPASKREPTQLENLIVFVVNSLVRDIRRNCYQHYSRLRLQVPAPAPGSGTGSRCKRYIDFFFYICYTPQKVMVIFFRLDLSILQRIRKRCLRVLLEVP